MSDETSKLLHAIANQLQAVLGYLELGRYQDAFMCAKLAASLIHQLRRVADKERK